VIHDLKTRQEFDVYMRDAIYAMTKLIAENPADKMLKAILNQLEAIEKWTAGGKNLTEDQKNRIYMGLQAQREMADFVDEKDLVISLHNYIIVRMPNAKPGP
jgi:hypothetical protein